MGTLRLMRAKLHQVRVSARQRDYVGSISIDLDLLEQVGMLPLEEVDVVNIDNGARWSTYVLPAERGRRTICPNGGGALLCEPGHRLIIFSYESKSHDELQQRGHRARICTASASNECVSLFEQLLEPTADGLRYRTQAIIGALPDQPEMQIGPQALRSGV